jgi:hypothetical protein
MALSAPVSWYGSGAATFVSHPSRDTGLPPGFVQASKHLGRPEADVYYIAPRLMDRSQTAEIWQALLKYLGVHAGDFGIQRLYACVPAQDEAVEVMAASGFVLYVRESLFRLTPSAMREGPVSTDFVREQREFDSFALQRLFDRYTPPVVQKAEGAFVKENDSADHHLIFQNWWQPDRLGGLVYERDDELLGAVQIRRGKKGHWLRFIGEATQQEVMAALLVHALHYLHHDGLPIYCGVRPYQNTLRVVLSTQAFAPITELARFVKYTAVHIREPVINKKRLLIESSFPGIVSSDAAPETKTTISKS